MAQAAHAVAVQASAQVAGTATAVRGRTQLGFDDASFARAPQRTARAIPATPLCAGCRASEARYGFRDSEMTSDDARPRALCFECFRIELTHRQAVAARLARGWDARQVPLPLEDTLKELTRRRRRAQIAARHALGI